MRESGRAPDRRGAPPFEGDAPLLAHDLAERELSMTVAVLSLPSFVRRDPHVGAVDHVQSPHNSVKVRRAIDAPSSFVAFTQHPCSRVASQLVCPGNRVLWRECVACPLFRTAGQEAIGGDTYRPDPCVAPMQVEPPLTRQVAYA